MCIKEAYSKLYFREFTGKIKWTCSRENYIRIGKYVVNKPQVKGKRGWVSMTEKMVEGADDNNKEWMGEKVVEMEKNDLNKTKK